MGNSSGLGELFLRIERDDTILLFREFNPGQRITKINNEPDLGITKDF